MQRECIKRQYVEVLWIQSLYYSNFLCYDHGQSSINLRIINLANSFEQFEDIYQALECSIYSALK